MDINSLAKDASDKIVFNKTREDNLNKLRNHSEKASEQLSLAKNKVDWMKNKKEIARQENKILTKEISEKLKSLVKKSKNKI